MPLSQPSWTVKPAALHVPGAVLAAAVTVTVARAGAVYVYVVVIVRVAVLSSVRKLDLYGIWGECMYVVTVCVIGEIAILTVSTVAVVVDSGVTVLAGN